MDEDPGYRQWIAPDARAILLLVHGLGANVARWEATANFFLKNRISSYAPECYDPKGYYGSILRLHSMISKKYPGKKIYLAGESLGGLYSFLLACREPSLFSGLVCFSPAFRSRLKLSIQDYIKILASGIYGNKEELKLPFDSLMCTRDVDYARMMDFDQREHRRVTCGAALETLFAQAGAKNAGKRLTAPVLFLVAGDDKIVDIRATAAIFKSLKAPDKTLIEYPGMYHSLSVDLGKEKVSEDTLKWIEKRL